MGLVNATTPSTINALSAFGSKFDARRRDVETSKLVRKDIAAAKRAGLLPLDIETSTTTHTNTTNASIKIRIVRCSAVVVSTKRVRHDVATPNVFSPISRFSAEGQRILDVLQAIVNAYRGEGLFGFVDFDSYLFAAQRAEIERAIRATASIGAPAQAVA